MNKKTWIFLFYVLLQSSRAYCAMPLSTKLHQPGSDTLFAKTTLPGGKSYPTTDTLYVKKGFFKSRDYNFNLKPGTREQTVHLTFKNMDTSKMEVIVELTNPFLKRVDFYTVKSEKLVDSLHTGSQFTFDHRYRNFPNFLYAVQLPARGVVDCYVFIHAGDLSGDFRLMVWNKEARFEYRVEETKYLSYFFVINLSFLFLLGVAISLTRQRYHWYYFIYALFGFLHIYAMVGLGFKNLWPAYPQFQNASVLLIANVYQVFGLLFVKEYFNVSGYRKKLGKVFDVLIGLGVLFGTVILFFVPFLGTLPLWIVFLNLWLFLLSAVIICFVAGFSIKIKKLKADSLWFIVGFAPHAYCIFLQCLQPLGLFSGNRENWFRQLAPVYIETIYPPNFLLWAVLWEMVIVFWLIIKRLERLYNDNRYMIQQLSLQKEKNMGTLLAGIEEERQRIAQELHDGSGMALSALKMKLHILKEKDVNSAAYETIGMLMEDVDRIYDEIRGISHNLMPKTLSKLGLYAAIDELVNQFKIAAPEIHLTYYRKTNVNYFTETAKIFIYRVVQELLTNIVKHSAAKEATLQIIRHSDVLLITIEDNGIGFDIKAQKTGIGLTGIKSRVQLLSGELSIDTSPLHGTFIGVSIPVAHL